jgi:predicted alpha/beta-fold hydrolase
MPLIHQSSYKGPPWYLYNAHLQTIIPSLFRQVYGVSFERERLELGDGDFVDLDWVDKGASRLAIITHGDTGRPYIKGMSKLFSTAGWDILAWNCRSCSGEMNRNFRLYDHGEINDIDDVIKHALKTKKYEQIILTGFSMGGNITLKYLGVKGKDVPDPVKYGIAISAPTDIKASSDFIENGFSSIYKKRFMTKLAKKIRLKDEKFPGILEVNKLNSIKNWLAFDEAFSSKLGGYKDAADFYYQTSAKNFTNGISVPTLLLNALNDPILAPECSDPSLAEKHPFLYLETPKHGGHVGFTVTNDEFSWAERRSLEFIRSMAKF